MATNVGTNVWTRGCGGAGAFLIRFSESQPNNLSLTYNQLVNERPRNCLLHNLGERGFGLDQSPGPEADVFATILEFVRWHRNRLTHPVWWALAGLCLHEIDFTFYPN